MQDCFRKYPEVYGAELADDEEAERASAAAPAAEGTPAEEEPVENKKEEALEHATHDATAANDNKKQQ